uniref:hypothetical protein n=1 Tax=Acetatifactor sp. TaxID=1872090 RepID=UPI0040570042
MRNWIAIEGDFSAKGEKIIFHGGTFTTPNQNPDDTNAVCKAGILLFEDMLSNGEIEVSVEFESFNEGDEAEILFNYQDSGHFMCTGVTNSPAKYEYKSFAGQWNYLKLAGFMSSPASNKYNLKVRLVGSSIDLYINNIKVLSATSNTPILKTNIGMWVRSKSKITISNYRATYQKSSAFIVSQFGDNYDILYKDVIKPICEKMDFNPIRVDEVTTATMILDDIISSIKSSAVIIADISPDNPNVFYELGYAHAINKPTILLCERSCRSKLPFDISGFRTIFYDNTIGGKKQVEQRLEDHLQALNQHSIT